MKASARICDGCGASALALGRLVMPGRWTRVHFSWTDDDGVSRSVQADVCPDALCAARALEIAREGAGRTLRVLAKSAGSGQ